MILDSAGSRANEYKRTYDVNVTERKQVSTCARHSTAPSASRQGDVEDEALYLEDELSRLLLDE